MLIYTQLILLSVSSNKFKCFFFTFFVQSVKLQSQFRQSKIKINEGKGILQQKIKEIRFVRFVEMLEKAL